MPSYTFQCGKCGLESEKFRTVAGRDELVKCPQCGRGMLRVFSQAKCPQVVRDTFGHEQRMPSLLAPSGNARETMTAQSRGEVKRALEAVNKAHGSHLVYEGMGRVKGRRG